MRKNHTKCCDERKKHMYKIILSDFFCDFFTYKYIKKIIDEYWFNKDFLAVYLSVF